MSDKKFEQDGDLQEQTFNHRLLIMSITEAGYQASINTITTFAGELY